MPAKLSGVIAATLFVLVSACSDRLDSDTEVTVNGVSDSEAETPSRLTPVDTEPVVEAPALAPLSRAEIEAELEPGAGCSVEEDGKALLVAVDGDAIARPHGTLRHFAFAGDLEALQGGGVFHAGVITITVTPVAGEGEQVEGVLVRSTTVLIQEQGQEGETEMRAEWHCGA
jgi:hypothetical protein